MSAARAQPRHHPWIFDLGQPDGRPTDGGSLGVGASLPPGQVLHLATTKPLAHIIQRDGHEFEVEMRAADRMVRDPDAFLRHPVRMIFPSEPDVAAEPNEPTVAHFNFCSSFQKKEVMAGVRESVQRTTRSNAMIDDILAVADELFTNAVYNAPFARSGNLTNPGVDRLNPSEIRYESGLESRMIVAADSTRLAVGCVDPFGTLNLPRYLHRIKETYVRGPAATMNFGPGGAGLGSYIIFNAGSSLYFGVWPEVATVLFCVVPLGMSNRKRAELPKHLHWIQR